MSEKLELEEKPVRSIVEHETQIAKALFPKVGPYLELLIENVRKPHPATV